VDSLLAKVTDRTKIVFIANPNNPTGTYLTQAEMRRLHAGLPRHVILVIDAAYAEFVRRNDYDAGIELVSGAENVVMTRTFSKVFGLAGLRIGWAFGPQSIINALNRVRGPFNASIPAQAAAIAALEDTAHLEAAIVHNLHWLEWTIQEITKLGLTATPSVGNFVLVKFPKTPGFTAAEVEQKLAQQAILVRAVKAYELPDYLRMTIGLEAECRALVEGLKSIMGTPHG
jgi:histidinol-phosphate aminotransferase